MNIIDKALAAVSPEAACRREAWRQQYEALKSYDAGGYGRVNSRWHVGNDSAENTDKIDRDIIRARARDLERNSDMANSVISAFRRNVMGGGYKLQAQTGNDELNDKIEALWEIWNKKRNCDVTGTQTLNQMLRMAITRKKVDGGILIKKCYTKEGIVPFQLQALDVDELSTTQMTPKNKGCKVVGGIEYNEYNKPIGYWIQQYSIDGFELPSATYYPAKDIIYAYTKHRPSQIREISDLSPTITRIRDANEFVTAVSVKERIAACLAVFIKKSVPTAGLGRNASIDTASKDYEGKTLSPGMITEMNAGDEVQVVDPKGSSADASSFLKTLERLIGSGQGLSYEATSRDMSQTNYSSARQGIIEDEYTYQEDVEIIIDILSEIYETFLISAVLSGALYIPEFWNKKTDFLSHKFVPSPKKWIDPYKEANANRLAMESGQKTFPQMSAELGRDWKEMIDEQAKADAYAKEKGVKIGAIGGEKNAKEE